MNPFWIICFLVILFFLYNRIDCVILPKADYYSHEDPRHDAIHSDNETDSEDEDLNDNPAESVVSIEIWINYRKKKNIIFLILKKQF